MDDMKFCKDCNNFASDAKICCAPAVESLDLVTGKIVFPLASLMRLDSTLDSSCGREAKLFEPKQC